MTSDTQSKFACPICETRSILADAISAEVKAAAQVYHLANHWRSAHEIRELSNFQAEDLTVESLAKFDVDTKSEADWYSQYQDAIAAHTLASQAAASARTQYHERLAAYTCTRRASK